MVQQETIWGHYNPTRQSTTQWLFLLGWPSNRARLRSFTLFWFSHTFVILYILLFKAVGATKHGQQYLVTKALIQTSTALNLAMYLLLKSEQTASPGGLDPSQIQSHPVISSLQKLNDLAQKLERSIESKVDGIDVQLENLVKAAALMKESPSESESESTDADGNNDDEKEGLGHLSDDEDQIKTTTTHNQDDEKSESSADSEALRRNVMNEARFGLRPSEINQSNITKRKKRKVELDYGDEVAEGANTLPSKSLATTLNSIEQRAAVRQRRVAPLVEGIDEHEEDDGELRRGLEMMEAALGKDSDDEAGGDSGEYEGGDASDEDYGDGFYAQVSKKNKSRKEDRKQRYQVAPKFPRVDREIEGERAISNVILKNRGLVAHKSKLNRNPRVKKREQYRKALIRRKGAVREVRTDEGHKYGGEGTGVKSNLSRSRKLA